MEGEKKCSKIVENAEDNRGNECGEIRSQESIEEENDERGG